MVLQRFDPITKRKNTYCKIDGFWYLKITDVKELELFNQIERIPFFIEQMRFHYNDINNGHHSTSKFCGASEISFGGNALLYISNLAEKTYVNQLNQLSEGYTLYVTSNRGYLIDKNNSYKIEEEKEILSKDYFDFNGAYNKDDIKVYDWSKGVFSAYVGKHIVTDSQGNKEWTSYETAKKHALEFLKNIFMEK